MAARVFFSYSHVDEALRNQIETQLSLLKRQRVIETWHDRRIGAGQEFAGAIDRHVESDDIILLLVSSDFIASDYCYDVEMNRAMERHKAGEAIVIPVILRACDWQGAPFGKLNATPPDGRPITQYADRDQALLEVAKAVRAAVDRLDAEVSQSEASPPIALPSERRRELTAAPRSSNLALSKTFTERDKDQFKHDSFEYISRFFENSLDELAARNDAVQVDFRRIDANRFAASIYKQGQAVSRCTIFVGDGSFLRGIAYSAAETSASNSYNELLTVEADDQSMFLRSMGIAAIGDGRGHALSHMRRHQDERLRVRCQSHSLVGDRRPHQKARMRGGPKVLHWVGTFG
jgi:hypothetical protein